MIRSLFTSISLFVLTTAVGQEAKTIKLQDYLLSEKGIHYQFKNLVSDGMDTIRVGIEEEVEYNGIKTQKRYENNGDYRLQTLDEKGLTIYWLYFIGDRVIDYAKPVVQIPSLLEKGKTYRSETKYFFIEKGISKDEGVQIYEVTVLGIEDLTLNGQVIENCLVMNTKASRIGKSGKEKGYELKEWYAPGVGAIKVKGPLFWNDEDGARTRTFQVDAEVEKTIIQGNTKMW